MSKVALLAIAIAVTPVSRALAIDYSWNLPGDGLWTTNANWTPVGQPNAVTDNVLIAHPAGPASAVAVTLNASRLVGNLTLASSSGGTNVLNVANNVDLSVTGTFTNNGRVNVTSAGNTTLLTLLNDRTFLGNGTIRLSGVANAARISGTTGVVVTNSATHTIEGNGNIGANQLNLINNGTIRANIAGQTLNIDAIDTGTNFNSGTISALAGATAAFQAGTWDNAGGVIQADGASALVTLQEGAIVRNGILRGANGGIVQVANSTNVFVENIRLEGSIRSNNDTDFGVTGSIVNTGTLSIESTGNATEIELQSGVVTFSGGGKIVLGGTSTAAGINGLAGTTLINAVDHTIEGKGRVGLNTIGVDNRGVISANNTTTALQIDPLDSVNLDGQGASFLNSGTLRASAGSTLSLFSGVYKNSGAGVIEADGASAIAELNEGVTIRNGTVRGVNGGEIRVANSTNVFFENLSLVGMVRGLNNTDTGISGTITHSGTLSIESTGNITDIEIQAAGATLTGSGTVVLGGTSTGAGINGIGLPTLVHDVNHRIEGKGNIGRDTIGIDNKGTIVANNTTTALDLDPANVDIDGTGTDFRNTGTLRAEAGATLRLNGGLYRNTNVIVADGAGASVTLNNLVTISGGTLRGINGGIVQATSSVDVFFENVTLEGSVRANNNSDINISGTFINNANLSIESAGNGTDLEIQQSMTLAGTGTVVLGGTSTFAGINSVDAAANYTLTNSATHTITGKGRLGQNFIGIINNGTITATDATTAITIDPSASGFVNNALLRAQGAGGLTFETGPSRIASGGTLQIDAGSKVLVQSGATLTLDAGGTLTQSGAITIASGGVFENKGNFGPFNAGTVGSVAMTGTFVNAPGSTLVVDLGGTTAGTQYDQIAGGGAATLAGTLDLRLINGFDPALYSPALLIIDDTVGSNITGRFSSVLNVGSGLKRLAVVYRQLSGTSAGEVAVVAAVAGDADVNGKVDFDDLVALAQNYNLTGRSWQLGDFNGDGKTDFDDLVPLAQNYNYGTGAVIGSESTFAADWALAQSLVPEPTTVGLLVAAATVTVRRRR